jgi:hypothetical protein
MAKCKFSKTCKHYQKGAVTCNLDGGMYSFNAMNMTMKHCGVYDKQEQPKDSKWWMYAAIFIISFIFRFALRNKCFFDHDSLTFASAVQLTNSLHHLVPASGNKLFAVLVYSGIDLYVKNIYWTGTIVTIIFACAAVIMLAEVCKLLFKNDFIAYGSAFLFSFNPLFFSFTTFTRTYAMAIFLMLMSIYCFIRALRERSNYYYILSSIYFVLMLFTRSEYFLILPVYFMLYLWLHKISDLHLDKPFMTYYQFKLLVVPLAFAFIGMLFGWITWYGNDYIAWNRMIPLLSYSMSQLMSALTIPGFVLFVIGCCYLVWKKKDHLFLFCMVWFASIFLPMSIISSTTPRLYMNAIIPIYIIITYMFQNYRWKEWIVICMLLYMFASISFVLVPRNEHCYTYDLAKAIHDIDPNASVMLEDADVFSAYYFNQSDVAIDANITGKDIYTTSIVYDLYNMSYKRLAVKTIPYEDFHHAELVSKVQDVTIYKLER